MKKYNYRKECVKFNMNIELAESWQQAEKLINEYTELWTVFKDYNEGNLFQRGNNIT